MIAVFLPHALCQIWANAVPNCNTELLPNKPEEHIKQLRHYTIDTPLSYKGNCMSLGQSSYMHTRPWESPQIPWITRSDVNNNTLHINSDVKLLEQPLLYYILWWHRFWLHINYNVYSDFHAIIWNVSLILLCHTIHLWSVRNLLPDKQKGWQNIPHLQPAFAYILKYMEKSQSPYSLKYSFGKTKKLQG